MKQYPAWLARFNDSEVPFFEKPSDLADFELCRAFPNTDHHIVVEEDMKDGYTFSDNTDGSVTLTGGTAGVLYGAYRKIIAHLTGTDPVRTSTPRYALRMLNCWDNPDGSVERGYSGNSIFFKNGKLDYDPSLIRHVARLMASVGLNVICINNVNVHFPGQLLLEDNLPDLAALAAIFRPFGVRLMVSIDFSRPMAHGIPTADPLDPEVRRWWKECVQSVYAAIPDLAGFLVKADSENRPGPFTYGRNHAEGANMLAEALRPFGGVVVWRCFVYNCRQDWRDTKTDRPMAAWEHYHWLDGEFADNVILQVKNGPVDFQVREPVSPLLLGMKKTSMALEVQLAQEYTGHQIDIYTMMPMWKEVFDDLPADNIMSTAAVTNFGNNFIFTGHPFAAVNLFGYGRLAWDPMESPEYVVRLWSRLTYNFVPEDEDKLTGLLLGSRRVYEKYTAPLGIGWMMTPHNHYGPCPSGYEYDLWGTYHKADHLAIGIDRTASGTGYTLQYPERLRDLYSNPDTCPDLLKLFFHRLPYTYVMSDGRTLIQRIYDDHFEGYDETLAMAETLKHLPFPDPDRSEIDFRMEKQIADAREWRDVINTFLHRLSMIDDIHGRKIYP